MKSLNILVKKPLMAEACIFCDEDEQNFVTQANSDCYVSCGNCGARGPNNADGETAIQLWNEALHRQQRKANDGKKELQAIVDAIPGVIDGTPVKG